MKKTNLKSKLSTITIVLILTISATFLSIPLTMGQQIEYSKETYPYIGATPNPVGVNQQVLLHIGIPDFLNVVLDGWEGLTVTVTKPNGETETLGPYRTDATGGTGDIYVPTMVGTYKLQSHFPEQLYDWEGGGSRVPFTGVVRYLAGDSDIIDLVVQSEPLPEYPGFALPKEYWTRPIDAQMREWSAVAGNYLAANRYEGPLTTSPAPQSSHVLWSKPIALGGLVGAELGDHAFEEGDAYEGKFQSSVILNGVLYYNRYAPASSGGAFSQGIIAIDLRTGEELWFRNNTRLAFGQIYYWDSFNMHGAFAYLWETVGRTWNAYDPLTGEWVYTMENVPSGSNLYGAKGEIFRYTVDLDEGWMTLWNSSRVVQPSNRGDSNDGSWGRQLGREREYSDRIYDAERGIEWNVTIPTGLPGSVNAVFYEDRIIGSNAPGESAQGIKTNPVEMWAISTKPGTIGDLLWQNSWNPPGDIATGYAVRQNGQSSVEDGVFVLYAKELRAYFGFDRNTGDLLWGPTESELYMNLFSLRANIHFGTLYSTGYAGTVIAYDLETGNKKWTYNAVDSYNEILWGNNWALLFSCFTPDHKILLFTMEHSPIDPKPRGGPTICIDADTGEELWKINMYGTRWGGPNLLGDSIYVAYNSYDDSIYAIGKGPSETSVTASPKVSTKGASVILEGKVTDLSAGTQGSVISARFPQGVPAVSDESMTEWMEYVYMQHERPTDATGVDVFIKIQDPNGDWQSATVTTDMNGEFSYMWCPGVVGEYHVTAMFEGTNSYYASEATTTFGVDAAQVIPETEVDLSSLEEGQSNLTMYILIVLVISILALIIAVILLLKSRK